jgi:Fe-S cluster assembly iron-binding protein IscA
MFEVTEAAQQKITEFFEDKEVRPIRLFLNSMGCGGPSLALGLDEPTETDEVIDVNGFQFVADKDLLAEAQPVTIDFKDVGFEITSSIKLAPAAGGCSGCGTSGTCC